MWAIRSSVISLGQVRATLIFSVNLPKKERDLIIQAGVKNLVERAAQGSSGLAGQHIWSFAFCSHCSRKQNKKVKLISLDLEWSLCLWLTFGGSAEKQSGLCSLLGGVHSRVWPRPLYHHGPAQPLHLLHHGPHQRPQGVRGTCFGGPAGWGTGLRVTNSIPFLLKQGFHFIGYVRNSGRDNETFLLKHFPFHHLNLLFFIPLLSSRIKKRNQIWQKCKGTQRTSLAELWGKSKFPMFSKLST